MRGRLLPVARGLLLGWAALLASVYLVDRPLARVLARVLDPSWLPTIQLALALSILLGTGWIVGRASRPQSLFAVSIVAGTIACWPSADLLGIQIPWLFRLAVDSFQDSRYFASFFNTALMQAILFSSLFAGARLSRESSGKPLSIFRS